jgi:cytidylate kinase
MSSRLAALPEVRRGLINIQRRLREMGPLVAEGRDLGTVVYPDADVKIFLDASMEVRAKRRFEELRGRDIAVTSDQVVEDLGRRDARDRERTESPLKPAADAVTIDTTSLGLEGQILAVVELVQRHPRSPVSR